MQARSTHGKSLYSCSNSPTAPCCAVAHLWVHFHEGGKQGEKLPEPDKCLLALMQWQLEKQDTSLKIPSAQASRGPQLAARGVPLAPGPPIRGASATRPRGHLGRRGQPEGVWGGAPTTSPSFGHPPENSPSPAQCCPHLATLSSLGPYQSHQLPICCAPCLSTPGCLGLELSCQY